MFVFYQKCKAIVQHFIGCKLWILALTVRGYIVCIQQWIQVVSLIAMLVLNCKHLPGKTCQIRVWVEALLELARRETLTVTVQRIINCTSLLKLSCHGGVILIATKYLSLKNIWPLKICACTYLKWKGEKAFSKKIFIASKLWRFTIKQKK